MKTLAYVLILILASTTLFAKTNNKDLVLNYSSYIVTQDEVRVFEQGTMHRDIFKWVCEPHQSLHHLMNKYDNIKSFEVFIKNDCSKKCQLVVITFKSGLRKKYTVNDYIIFTELNPNKPMGFTMTRSGPFAKPELLSKLPVVSKENVMIAYASW